MHAQKKPSHVSDLATRKSGEGASAQRRRDPREDDKDGTKRVNLTEPIHREPDPTADSEDEPRPPIIREPDEPEETKPVVNVPPIQRPDEEEA